MSGTTLTEAIAAGEAGFSALAERHRRELHVHCYRMLASFDDAEDAVQETMLRAWRGRAGFGGGAFFRAWLYRIATNVCLDTASLLETSVPAANSALQRARATMQAHLPARRADWPAATPTPEERALLEGLAPTLEL